MVKRPSKRWVDAGVAIVFLALSSAPMLVTEFAESSFDVNTEHRYAAPFPSLSMATLGMFPRAYEAWVNDHFAFRNRLIQLANLMRLMLGASPRADVVSGKKGFLFYSGDRALESFRRTASLGDMTLAQWRFVLEARREFLAARGVRYLVVFNPDKETIYPEMMPRALNRMAGQSPLEQLMAALRIDERLDVLDTTAAVRAAKTSGQLVFDKTDTHWNGVGRVAAVNDILRTARRWFPTLTELGPADVRVTHTAQPGGDLSDMLALRLWLREPDRIDVTPITPRAQLTEALPVTPGVPPFLRTRRYHVDEPTLPTAVVLGDSFMGSLTSLLAERFQRTFYVYSHDLNEQTLTEQHPSIVIEGWLERYVLTTVPSFPTIMAPIKVADGEPPWPSSVELPLDNVASRDLRWQAGTFLSIGYDPYITFTIGPIRTKTSQSIVVEMQADPNGVETTGLLNSQLFFELQGSPLFEQASVRFPILRDGHPHRYRIFPSVTGYWVGVVDAFRLDFPDGVPGFSYHVTKITLEDANPNAPPPGH
jgi:hypothetical protein